MARHPLPMQYRFYGKTDAAVSWWLTASPNKFTERATQELRRMNSNRESASIGERSLAYLMPPLPAKMPRREPWALDPVESL